MDRNEVIKAFRIFGFSILLLVVIAVILSILKLKIFIKKRRCMKMRELATDVYVKTEYRKNNSKPKVKFQAVIGKVLVSAIVLSTIISGVASMPVYASTGDDNIFNSTVTYNYEISVENTIFQVKQTIKLIEEMKSTGLVTNEVLSKLASQLMELEKAVQISGKAVTQEIEDVILEVENVINGVKGSETVETVLRVTKKSLNISGSIEVINIKQAKAVQLSDIGTHWGKANIERLVGLNAISGYPDGTFKPNNTISFAEFLKIAVSSVEKDIKQAPSGSHWASGVYQTAIEKEIIKSSEFEGTKERFDSTISREDMALILVRLNEVSKGNNQVDTSKTKGMIQDHSKIASNRTYFVEQAFQKGLLKGKGNGFDPKGNLTRAEAATAIINLLDYKEGTVVEAPIVKTGTEKAKELFDNIPVYNQKTNHGLKFEGVGYTLDDVAVFAKSYLSVYLNYDGTDKVSMDKWEQEVLGYMTTGSIESIAKAKQIYIESKDKCIADIIVDASKIEIKNGNFIVHSAFFDNVSSKIFKVEVTIGGHNVNKSEIAVGYVNIKEVK